MHGSDPNICALANDDTGLAPAAFVFHQPLEATTDWMALCNAFYAAPATVGPEIPASATNLDLYKSQGSLLLHERK
jgi:hypothetical protein